MSPDILGMEYWERLADIINREPVFERDRLFMAMLKPLGIEKGKAFKPNKRQKKPLTEATLVGEAIAKANDFAKRMKEAHYVDGVDWHFVNSEFGGHNTYFVDESASFQQHCSMARVLGVAVSGYPHRVKRRG